MDKVNIKSRASKAEPVLTEKQISAMVERLTDNEALRRPFPAWGRIHIDRQLPFLCVYRRPLHCSDDATHRLLVAEAAYALVPENKKFHPSFSELLRRISSLMVDRFGAYLIVEIWPGKAPTSTPVGAPPRADFCIHKAPGIDMIETVNAMQEGLSSIRTSKQSAEVSTRESRKIAPPGMKPLLSLSEQHDMGVHLLGLEVAPVYINPKTKEPFPLLIRSIKRQLGIVLDKAFYNFAHECTTHQPAHYHALGRRAMVKAVWDTDRRLAAVSNSFDFLFQTTPVNAERAWRTFKRKHFEAAPRFLYRPRVVDPGLMKRALYDIHIERVEDPALMHLFLDKQMELDRQLTMLHDLDTAQFRYGSLQLHGNVSDALLRTAKRLLERTEGKDKESRKSKMLPAVEFAQRATMEMDWYKERCPGFKATAVVTDDMYTGLMVSRGRLLIGRETKIPEHRADALLHHEVGTHLLTYFNGQAQPFKMLYTGLPGYDALQEGIAVLSEYLVGGLTRERMRVLAARVVAVHALVDGASFVEVFRLLNRTHHFAQRTAYTMTMRVFRGGGLLKDAVYLRGLIQILKHLGNKGDFDTLFTGKIAVDHIGVIEELLSRKILLPPPLLPRYLENDKARRRLDDVRKGITVLNLVEPKEKLR